MQLGTTRQILPIEKIGFIDNFFAKKTAFYLIISPFVVNFFVNKNF